MIPSNSINFWRYAPRKKARSALLAFGKAKSAECAAEIGVKKVSTNQFYSIGWNFFNLHMLDQLRNDRFAIAYKLLFQKLFPRFPAEGFRPRQTHHLFLFFQKPLQYHRSFHAGRAALRVEDTVAFAGDEPCADRPGHALLRPV